MGGRAAGLAAADRPIVHDDDRSTLTDEVVGGRQSGDTGRMAA
jgi:hypothetical protein